MKDSFYMPKRIRMTAKHNLSGHVLERVDGQACTIKLGGGIIVSINTGDYASYCSVMTHSWLLKNPSMWEAL